MTHAETHAASSAVPQSTHIHIEPARGRRFLDATQAAEYLGGLNPRTVIKWAREGYLPAYPIGEGKRRLWRFLESDLERWMLARQTGGFDVDGCGKENRLTLSHRCSDRRKIQ
jgi:excisionase family DNA binding protein